ncbi:MAG: methyltransferase [Bifidobacterium sp.]|jgi:predicted O-methyltransferase YrrM|nr:methyltransferase [Bifidobacterium sp.]MCH4174527.1 methyltransferase [Bifidobacterium sp.]
MNKTSYTNLSKAWEFTESYALDEQRAYLQEVRSKVEAQGHEQGSAAQARFLRMLVGLTNARSVILVGTAAAVETIEIIDAMHGSGQLTVVDSSSDGAAVIRSIFNDLDNVSDTRMRVVNATAGVFLPRLNADDYDLIVVTGDASNYTATYQQSSRLLKQGGATVFTDMMGFAAPDSSGGLLNPVDREPKTLELRSLLNLVENDEHTESALIPVGTGMLLTTHQ